MADASEATPTTAAKTPKQWLRQFLSKMLSALPPEPATRLRDLVYSVKNGKGRVKLLTLCSGTDAAVDLIQAEGFQTECSNLFEIVI